MRYKIGDKVKIKDKESLKEMFLQKGGFFIKETQLLENGNDCFGKKATIIKIHHIRDKHYFSDEMELFINKYDEYILDINRGITWRDYMLEPIK